MIHQQDMSIPGSRDFDEGKILLFSDSESYCIDLKQVMEYGMQNSG